jgi:cytochrome c nitrite reductase small subunit
MNLKIGKAVFIHKYLLLYFFIAVFLLIIPSPGLILGASDSSPEERSNFCINCHTMEAEYEAWIHSSHRRKMCVDCHLPNENLLFHYFWKSIDGIKDVALFYSGQVPGRIRISSHGIGVIKTNCIRCHETTVMLIDKERNCWGCHKRISHFHTGVRGTD